MSETNPYVSPSSELEFQENYNALLAVPRKVAARNGWQWLVDSFVSLMGNPVAWVMTLFAYMSIAGIFSMVPLIGTIVWYVVGYILEGGIMKGCQTQSEGGSLRVGHLFEAFSEGGDLAILGLLKFVALILLIIIMFIPAGIILGLGASMDSSLSVLLEGAAKWILFYILMFLLFVVPAAMMFWFAPCLIALDKVPPIEAMKLSFTGCLSNLVPFTVYGLVGLLFAILLVLLFSALSQVSIMLATIISFIVLLLIGPMGFSSIYHSYRDIFFAEMSNG